MNILLFLRRLIRRSSPVRAQEGATMIEYALIAGLISVVAAVAVTQIGTNVNTTFGRIRDSLATAAPAA